MWKEELGVPDLKPNLEMFFEFTEAGVYLSAGKDDYAFNKFYGCRAYS